jgi:hypothetical protein
MPQPQLGSTAQPQAGSQQAGAQQARRARRALIRAKMQQRRQAGSQQSSQQQSASQPQLGSAQPQAGSTAQPHAGMQQVSWQQACLAAMRARSRANRPQRGAHGSQHESQAISQPQLGSAAQPHAGSAQPQLGSQPQPPRPKNAFASEARASASATPSVDSR